MVRWTDAIIRQSRESCNSGLIFVAPPAHKKQPPFLEAVAFSDLILSPTVAHGFGVAAGVGAGVGGFGLAWLAEVSTIVRALL